MKMASCMSASASNDIWAFATRVHDERRTVMGTSLKEARHVTNILSDLVSNGTKDERLETWHAAYQHANRTEVLDDCTNVFKMGKLVRREYATLLFGASHISASVLVAYKLTKMTKTYQKHASAARCRKCQCSI